MSDTPDCPAGTRLDLHDATVMRRVADRQALRDTLPPIRERLVARITHQGKAIRRLEATMRLSASRSESNVGAFTDAKGVADALLKVCRAAREGEFSQGVKSILNADPAGVTDTVWLAAKVWRLGWADDRQAILEYLAELNELPPRTDDFSDPDGVRFPSQLGVWDAVRDGFDAILPWPYGGNAHPWHTDSREESRILDELSPEPREADTEDQADEALSTCGTTDEEADLADFIAAAVEAWLLDAATDETLAPPGLADPPPGPQEETTGKAKGESNSIEPDGPFDHDGFRFRGVEVRFKRASKRYGLVLALWDSAKKQPAPARKIEEVMAEVWGHDHDTTEAAFKQLCSDARGQLDKANCPLGIATEMGTIRLSPK